MEIRDVNQIVTSLAREAIKAMPEVYPVNESNKVTTFAKDNIALLAAGYWSERNEHEIERDEKLCITENDYFEWCMNALEVVIADYPSLDGYTITQLQYLKERIDEQISLIKGSTKQFTFAKL